jgi:hypothetical protein
MNPNIPFPVVHHLDKSLMVAPDGILILCGYANYRDVGSGEINGFNCSLNLPGYATPHSGKLISSLNRVSMERNPFTVLGIKGSCRFAVMGISGIGERRNYCPNGLFLSMYRLGVAYRGESCRRNETEQKGAVSHFLSSRLTMSLDQNLSYRRSLQPPATTLIT